MSNRESEISDVDDTREKVMYRLGGLTLLAFLASFDVSTLWAAEIQGKIAAVAGQKITINVDSDPLPVAGDRVRVVVNVPSIGEAKVGTGRVTEVRGTQVLATIDKASGKLEVGQTVRITSSKSQSKGDAPTTPKHPPMRAPTAAPVPETPPSGPPNTVHKPPLAGLGAAEPIEITSSLVGQDAQGRDIVRAVAEALPRLHLSRHPVDDEIGRRAARLFIDGLDADKLFFNQEDVDTFLEHGHVMADELRRGDLNLTYEIFRLFLNRLGERIALGQQLLNAEHDFAIEEDLLLRDPSIQWPLDQTAAAEIWRKSMKYHMLMHRAAGADWTDARRRTAGAMRDLVRRMQTVSDEDLRTSMLMALAAAYDPNSKYLPQKAFADENAVLNQQMVGIGAALSEIEGYVTVQRLIADGPADRDGHLKAGDRIVGVGQGAEGPIKDVVGKRLAEVVSQIRGPEDSIVRLRVMPKGQFEAWVYKITRGKVDLALLGTAILSGEQLPGSRSAKLGYVHMPAFYTDLAAQQAGRKNYRSSARDLRPRLEEFRKQDVHVVVVDLRNNNGGTTQESLDTASLFLGGAPALQNRDREGNVTQHGNQNLSVAWEGPLVVLTNRVTAGGGEILAAAIQDYDRGLVLGDPATFGMGTVADFFDVGQVLFGGSESPKLGYLKLTTSKFYRVNGQSTQLRGVVPHVLLPSPTADAPIGEKAKTYALQADAVDALQYTGFGFEIEPDLQQTLTERSKQRRQSSPHFLKLDRQQVESASSRNGRAINLNEQAFLAARRSETEDEAKGGRPIPGLPAVTLDGYLQETLAVALDYSNRAYCAVAERQYLRSQYALAIENYQRSVDTDPDSGNGHYGLAWVLGTCPESEFRDGNRAIKHARKACELSEWKDWTSLLALAIGEAEVGRFDDANTHLTQALEMAPAEQRDAYGYLRQRFAAGQSYGSP